VFSGRLPRCQPIELSILRFGSLGNGGQFDGFWEFLAARLGFTRCRGGGHWEGQRLGSCGDADADRSFLRQRVLR